jgi:hypothetical protein
MGLTAINVGLNCVGPAIPVARCVGRKKALELLLYGNLLKAEEAMSLGLINKIVPKDELETKALEWAEELARKSPIAVSIAKTGFYASEDMNYEAQFAYMNEAFARLCTTDDAKEGVKAFLEKRKPSMAGKIVDAIPKKWLNLLEDDKNISYNLLLNHIYLLKSLEPGVTYNSTTPGKVFNPYRAGGWRVPFPVPHPCVSGSGACHRTACLFPGPDPPWPSHP